MDNVRLRVLVVPVRLRTPLERARPREGETEDVDGDVRPGSRVSKPVLEMNSIVSSDLRVEGSVSSAFVNDDAVE